ncbi:DUF559 domain-containing protein [Mumia sp. DW29H23]|uniref:DUF559 domain-containing protein n=1 Tax=Mumia sp. DW29H23 TaxID=3421241 RepID=UPI003D687E35
MPPFTAAQARSAGITDRRLGGPGFRRLFRGVYVAADVEPDLLCWIQAALLLLPADAAASHLTALRLYGLELRGLFPLHFSTNTTRHRRRRGITLHRRRGLLNVLFRHGVRCLGPDRTYVDCATILGVVELVQAAEHLLHAAHTSYDDMKAYLERTHIDGVLRARRAFALVREGAESPMETLVRLALVFARLPEPEVNLTLVDGAGRFLGRCDLVYRSYRVVVEYDGAWHERSRKQRAYDRTRRENLERDGWIVIVVLDDDLPRLRQVAWRVHRALRERGYDGPAPAFNAMWATWFDRTPTM